MGDNRLLRVLVFGGVGLIGAAATGGLLACEARGPMREGPPAPREGPPPPSSYTSPVADSSDAGAPLQPVAPDAAPAVTLPREGHPPPGPHRMPREGPPPPRGNGH